MSGAGKTLFAEGPAVGRVVLYHRGGMTLRHQRADRYKAWLERQYPDVQVETQEVKEGFVPAPRLYDARGREIEDGLIPIAAEEAFEHAEPAERPAEEDADRSQAPAPPDALPSPS